MSATYQLDGDYELFALHFNDFMRSNDDKVCGDTRYMYFRFRVNIHSSNSYFINFIKLTLLTLIAISRMLFLYVI